MKVNSLMHIAFYTDKFDEMIDFYVNKLGFQYKYDVRYKEYSNRSDRPKLQNIAQLYPDKIFNAYIEVAEGQFIELFHANQGMKDHPAFNEYKGYSHFAFVVEDIYEVREEFKKKGIELDSDISKGPSNTYQMWTHDPDGNKFEIMQYTSESIQIRGKQV